MKDKIDAAFIEHAADILVETYTGLSGGQIVKHCNNYAIDFNVDIPIASPDFGKFGSIVPNKRTALYKNLMAFNGKQQFVIIKELCELSIFQKNNSQFRFVFLPLCSHCDVKSLTLLGTQSRIGTKIKRRKN